MTIVHMGWSPSLVGSASIFEQFEIVCLEHDSMKLYAEVVQTVEVTQICWVRPLMLMQSAHLSPQAFGDEATLLYDLRQGSDLLLPIKLFRNALDTEVIPLLEILNNLTEKNCSNSTNSGKLNQFIQQVCLAHPEVF